MQRVLLSLPYFLLSVWYFFWSNAIGSIVYKIKFLNILGRRKDTHDW